MLADGEFFFAVDSQGVKLMDPSRVEMPRGFVVDIMYGAEITRAPNQPVKIPPAV